MERKTGNQIYSLNSSVLDPTIIPAIPKINTKIIMTIIVQQIKLESYQEVMGFLKKGF